jgi:hypothetical protein
LTLSAYGTSLLPRERTTLTPSFEEQTCGELPAADKVLGDPGEVLGEVLGDPAAGEVLGEVLREVSRRQAYLPIV